ncbi:ATP-binding cassette sub- D member 4 [Allomyces arbusculus]|nr:ATP-binding cassette sub- D member 4 [Allomyces arbusculus]
MAACLGSTRWPWATPTTSSTPHDTAEYQPLPTAEWSSRSAPSSSRSPTARGRSTSAQREKTGTIPWPAARRLLAISLAPRTGAFMALVALILGSIVNELIIFQSGSLPSQFYQVLLDQDRKGFDKLLVWGVLVMACSAVAKTACQWLVANLALRIRTALTTALHAAYFARLRMIDALDYPDQRIAQDTDRLATLAADTVHQLLLAPFLIASYTYQLASLSGWLAPVVIFGYFILGSLASAIFIKAVAAVVAAKDKAEGRFRAAHAHVRSGAEAILFTSARAPGAEQARLDSVFEAVISATRRVMAKHWVMSTVTEFFSYFGSILNYVVVGMALFAGRYDDLDKPALGGVISQTSFVAIYLIFKLTSVISLLNSVSDLAGHALRVSAILEWEGDDGKGAGGEGGEEEEDSDEDAVTLVQVVDEPNGTSDALRDGEVMALEHASVVLPGSKRVLFPDVSLTVRPNDFILITGPSGIGKTSLLRVLTGIWPTPTGRAARSNDTHVVPARPYFIPGSLVAQLNFPLPATAPLPDSDAHALLSMVGLSHLTKRAGGVTHPHDRAWYAEMLSAGEQHLLAVARAVRHRPRVVIVDEAGANVDDVAVRHVFAVLREVARATGMAVVAVGHRGVLKEVSDAVYEVRVVGGPAGVGVDGEVEMDAGERVLVRVR